MARTYYQIELTARQLSLVLGGLALLVAVSFALGYGAAWTVLSGSAPVREAPPVLALGTPTPEASPTPVAVELPAVGPEATPAATAAPTEVPTAAPTATAEPTPAPTATPAPPAAPERDGHWVQVLAAEDRASVTRAQNRLEELHFGPEHQWLLPADGGNPLFRLRVGPFPDRASADRVARRMQASGFTGAWVVSP